MIEIKEIFEKFPKEMKEHPNKFKITGLKVESFKQAQKTYFKLKFEARSYICSWSPESLRSSYEKYGALFESYFRKEINSIHGLFLEAFSPSVYPIDFGSLDDEEWPLYYVSFIVREADSEIFEFPNEEE